MRLNPLSVRFALLRKTMEGRKPASGQLLPVDVVVEISGKRPLKAAGPGDLTTPTASRRLPITQLPVGPRKKSRHAPS